MFFSKANKIIEQLELHSNIVLECYHTYLESCMNMYEAMEDILSDYLHTTVNQLSYLEKKADRVRHEVIRYLLNGGFLVDNRKSTMRLIEGLDHVADTSEDIIQMISFEKILIPKWLLKFIVEINDITNQQLELYIALMKKIVSQYKFKDIIEDLENIEMLESKVDKIEINAIQQIYAMDTIELAYKNQLKALVNLVTKISDDIEDLSDEIEIILASRRV